MLPLAERLRPRTLDEYVGQSHLVGEQGVLRRAITGGRLPSIILWGPPGVGKTTLATIIAHTLDRPFYALSAINSGVKDVRETIAKAKKQRFFNQPNPVLFIDEIHRFSKAQQDSLLGAVEQGVVTLIGATTENPSFEVISALLSRCQVYVLQPLVREELLTLAERAVSELSTQISKPVTLTESDALLRYAGGDARKLYNVLEIVVHAEPDQSDMVVVTDEKVTQRLQQNLARYDKGGEQHYDIASAFIKSIRGSDPNAAVYYLARMLEGGEDVKFIARRLLISAAEDVGLANPNALLLAQACFDAVRVIGMPEARIILSQCAVYLAASEKSNASYEAIGAAQQLVRKTGNLPVPLHLRNAPTRLMKQLDYGKDYKYAHSYDGNFAEQEFLPEEVAGSVFYKPGYNAHETRLRERLKKLWKGKYGY